MNEINKTIRKKIITKMKCLKNADYQKFYVPWRNISKRDHFEFRSTWMHPTTIHMKLLLSLYIDKYNIHEIKELRGCDDNRCWTFN